MPSPIHHGEILPSTPEASVPVGGFVPPEANEGTTPSMTLRDFFMILRRRRWAAIPALCSVVALGVVFTLLSKPTYRTSTRLLVEGRTNALTLNNSTDPVSSIFQPKAGRDVDTQVEILGSGMILDRVFKQAQVAPSLVNVDVHRVDRTDVIEVVVTSSSRDGAARVARALPLVYEQDTRQDRLGDVSAALNFARNSLSSQTAKLRRTELALERFKNGKGIVNSETEATGAVTAAAQSRADLEKAQVDVRRLQAQFDTLSAQRAGLSAFIQTPVTTTNPAVGMLNDQLAALQSQRKQLLFLYKAGDDEVKKVDLQIADLRGRLANTPLTITNTTRAPNPALATLDEKIGGARADLRAASDTLAPLRSQVGQQTRDLGRFNTITRREAELSRDLQTGGDAVKTLSQNVLQLTLRETALAASGAPVSTMQAAPPAAKISPSLSRNLIASLFLGTLLACGVALLLESLDDHVRDQDEVRRLFGTATLGYFPLLVGKRPRPLLDLENPDRAMLEGFRALRSNVQFALVSATGRRLLVTSSVPGEGKSYIASNLAIAMALNGHNVVLVDADLHRPRVHTAFGIPNTQGLSNVLIGEAKLDDCVREVGVPGLRIITAGATPPNPTELLSSTAMDALIDRLGKGANVVIFDSPPMLATADPQVLASKVDGVIFVMYLGHTARSSVARSFELLRQARARVIGVVFNRVEAKETQGYEEYSGYYDEPVQGLLGSTPVTTTAKSDDIVLSPANGFVRKNSLLGSHASTNGQGAKENGASVATNGDTPPSHGENGVTPDANGITNGSAFHYDDSP